MNEAKRLRLLAAAVAHELRNRCHAMLLHVDLLRGGGARSIDDVLRGELDRIEALVHDWQRTGGPAEEQRREVAVTALVDAACRRSGDTARTQRGRCDDIRCELDDDAIGHALDELIANALAAGSTVEVEGRRGGDNLIIAVRDDGPGLPDGDLSRLGQLSGAGIGLVIARHVARAHGGSLVSRRDGRHTEVALRLPIL